ncbi:MAG TPA: gliding motility protein GldM [Bacteroidia bacterium]|jgi:gliding motility-associated protein GldM|nr:gliding motility protein GldM [Bacteroidia bacterium]
MSLPKEPRQKMINIMYLVLTALLALNVSKQILNAFVIVNNGLQQTNKNFDVKNTATMNQFEKAMANDKLKTKKYYDQAQLIHGWSKTLCSYIDTLKVDLIGAVEGLNRKAADTTKLMDVQAKDNFDIPTHILINDAASEDGSKGKAHELKLKMRQYRKELIDIICQFKASDTTALNIGLITKDHFSSEEDRVVNWEIDNFSERPLAASVVMLTKTQNDVKNAEATVVQWLLGQISANDFKVSGFEPEVIANSNYVLLGDSFRAKLFVSAVSSTQQPEIIVGDVDTNTGKVLGHVDQVRVKSGTGFYAAKADKEGQIKFAGVINVKAPDGTIKGYPFHSSYLVAKPALVISPTKMNVFYIGVPNPVEISVPGVPDEDLRPSFGGPGGLSGGKGKYTVNVNSGAGTECTISVSAKMPDGSSKSMGNEKFRIKRVPDPICYVANKKGDISIPKAQLEIATQVQARMDGFDFDLTYAVTGFTMAVVVNGLSIEKDAHSNLFTPDMQKLIKQISPGTHVIIENVHVRGPDSRTIPGVNIKIN